MIRLVLAAAIVVAAAACSSAQNPSDAPRLRNSSVLLVDEIEASRAPGWTAHDLITTLRPQFLRSRGVSSLRATAPTTATVYVDGMRFGEIESLRSLPALQILRVEYINASDATTRFGTDHVGGAILISTK